MAATTSTAHTPLVIAHRGASGYLPEHTLAAKAAAHAMGADFLEQDVVATRDGELIVFHDLHLDDVTDVAARFRGRARDDGLHYVIDFNLDEIRSLQVTERRRRGSSQARFPGRFPLDVNAGFRIPTLREELQMIAGLNRATGREAGIYVELKSPDWHRRAGIDLARRLVELLAEHGFGETTDAAWIQCFDPAELIRLQADLGSRLKRVQLIDSGQTVDRETLRRIAGYAQAIGPALMLLRASFSSDGGGLANPAGERRGSTGLVDQAHEAGLLVHPYTVRADELPPGASSMQELLHVLVEEEEVDGFFTDFPDRARKYLQGRSGLRASGA